MLDPRHKSKLPRLAEALEAFGHHVAITVSGVSEPASTRTGKAKTKKRPIRRRDDAQV